MYSPNIGFTPRTRWEMVRQAYVRWVELTETEDTFAQFQGSNVHMVLNLFFQEIEALEAKIVELQASQFSYWSDKKMAIQASLGSAYEGWLHVFEPLCSGLDLVGHSEDKTLAPGEIAIYFDNLKDNEQAVREAFLRCKNIAEPTPRGDHSIDITYSNGQVRRYQYFNLLPANYTPIEVQIQVQYQNRSLQYKDSDFVEHFTKNFNKVNYINAEFYPESYMDITTFPGVADFTIKTKLAGDADWVVGLRSLALGNKLTLDGVSVLI